MRAVKLSGLEKMFIEHIDETRNKQLNDIFYVTFWLQMIVSTTRIAPSFVNSATIATYIFSKNIPQSLFVAEVQPISADFLILPELIEIDKKLPTNPDLAVEVTNCSFGWGNPSDIPMTFYEREELEMEQAKHNSVPQVVQIQSKSQPSFPPSSPSIDNEYDNDAEKKRNKKKMILNNISFSLPKGSLTMVIGSVGSGKSSLGSVLIGDIELVNNEEQVEQNIKQNNEQNYSKLQSEQTKGEIRIDGSIAYCPQTAWINNNTVRENIIFGNVFNEEKYNDVVHVCALEPDFQALAAGDLTAIGEKGVNLSGGQKARIQLARAVYSDKDIYILDDPLSAVDAHVGKILFEECIN
ncbi:MAG: putative multi drug resistance-associated protein MRP, partial [Streblomastix strix]